MKVRTPTKAEGSCLTGEGHNKATQGKEPGWCFAVKLRETRQTIVERVLDGSVP